MMLHDNPQSLIQIDTAQFGTFSVNSQVIPQSTKETCVSKTGRVTHFRYTG